MINMACIGGYPEKQFHPLPDMPFILWMHSLMVNIMRKTRKSGKFVFGIGVNDSDAPTQTVTSGKYVRDSFYVAWVNMLRRCYDNNGLQSDPTYTQCVVDPDWHYFSVFREWMQSQDWQGKHLDKDIIEPNCQVYSADTCCFVTRSVNNLLCNSGAVRGDCPQGLYFDKNRGKYHAQVSVNGKYKAIGRYVTVEAAENAYRSFKALVISAHASRETDGRIAAGLWKHVELYRVKK